MDKSNRKELSKVGNNINQIKMIYTKREEKIEDIKIF